jgi:hypothetical protein
MYEVILNVIKSKRYELADMLTKIDTLWVQGSINEEQRNSLVSDAQNNAMVENSIDVLKSLYDLNRRVTEVEKQLEELKKEENSDTPTEEETETPTYPPYVVGKWYQNGDIVDFDGQIKKCIAPIGTVCVWSPTEYPAYWVNYVEEPSE